MGYIVLSPCLAFDRAEGHGVHWDLLTLRLLTTLTATALSLTGVRVAILMFEEPHS